MRRGVPFRQLRYGLADRAAELRQVVGQLGGDQAAVADDWSGRSRPPALTRSSWMIGTLVTCRPGQARRDQQPAGVADGGNGRAASVDLADQHEEPGLRRRVLRREAAGHDHGSRSRPGRRRRCRRLGHGRVADLAGVHLARARTDEGDCDTGLPEAKDRVPELELLIEVLDQDRDARIQRGPWGVLGELRRVDRMRRGLWIMKLIELLGVGEALTSPGAAPSCRTCSPGRPSR